MAPFRYSQMVSEIEEGDLLPLLQDSPPHLSPLPTLRSIRLPHQKINSSSDSEFPRVHLGEVSSGSSASTSPRSDLSPTPSEAHARLERTITLLSSVRCQLDECAAESARLSPDVDLARLVVKRRVVGRAHGGVYQGSYDGKPVLVKVYQFGDAQHMHKEAFHPIQTRFRREMAIWRGLDHPSISQCLGSFTTGPGGLILSGDTTDRVPEHQHQHQGQGQGQHQHQGQGSHTRTSFRFGGHSCCVVTEHVEGGCSLKDMLQRHRRTKLQFNRVMQIALDLARGVYFLHSNKIIHGDISTASILVTKQKRPKIMDLGIARVEAEAGAGAVQGKTLSSNVSGSMAPEVLEGRTFDEKADVYSFGVCLWEIYCCDEPFPALSRKDMEAFVQKGHRPKVPGRCPADLAQVMERCWASSPSKRPDMSEVVAMLEDVDRRKGKGMVPVKEVPSAKCNIL